MFTAVLLVISIMVQFAVASVAEEAAGSALGASATAIDKLIEERGTGLAPDDIRLIERVAALDLATAPVVRDRQGNWRAGHASGALLPGGLVRRALRDGGSEPVTLALAAGPSIAIVKPVPGGALLLSYPLAAAMAPFRTVQMAVLLAGGLGLGLILLGSWAIAYQIARPISALDCAVGRLREGEAVEVVPDSHDEIGRLGESFNAMARLAHLAMHDALTGLPNRTLFHARLSRHLEEGDRISLLCIDLDGFKDVNDALGHSAGDVVLKVVAERMSSAAPGAMIARLGGDEFTVILPPALRQADEWLAQGLIETLSAPVMIDGLEARVGASIGIASQTQGLSPEQLLHRADCALYAAKQAGKNTHRRYEALHGGVAALVA